MTDPTSPGPLPNWFTTALQIAKDMLRVDWASRIEWLEQLAIAHPFIAGMAVGAALAVVLMRVTTIIRLVIIGAALTIGGFLLSTLAS